MSIEPRPIGDGPEESTAGGCRPGALVDEQFIAGVAAPRDEGQVEGSLGDPITACVHHAGISPLRMAESSQVTDEALMSRAELTGQFPPGPPRFEHVERQQVGPPDIAPGPEKEDGLPVFHGKSFRSLGPFLLQHLMEVIPLRSQSKGSGESALFPLPTSIDTLLELWPSIQQEVAHCIACVCVALNSLWGGLSLGRVPTRRSV